MAGKTNRELRWGDGYVTIRENKDGSFSAQARWKERHPVRGVVWRSHSVRDWNEDTAHDAALDYLRTKSRRKRKGDDFVESSITISDAVRYMAERRLDQERWSEGTYATNMVIIERIIDPVLGKQRATRMKPAALQGWVDSLVKAKVGGSTVSQAVSILRNTFRQLVQQGVIAANPVDSIEIATRTNARDASWSIVEVRSLIAATQSDLRMQAFYILGFSTGMRPGEISALRWSDIDWEAGSVRCQRTIKKDRDQRPYVGTSTKTGAGRVIAIGQPVLDALKAWKVRQNEIRLASTEWKDTIIFDRGNGEFTPPTSLLKQHYKVVRNAGVSKHPPHVIRHTYASLAAAANTPPAIVQARLGHSSPEFTLRHYTHTSIEMQKGAADSIARQLLNDDSDTTTWEENREKS